MAKPPNPELAKRILDIARGELADKPPERVNMRGIAARAGVSSTAIYYYFASKGELFQAISFDALESLVERIDEEAVSAHSGREKLSVLVRVFMGWCEENPHGARLVMEKLPAQDRLTEEQLRRYYSLSDLAKQYLEEGIAEGDIEPRDTELDISLAQAALWGIFTLFQAKRLYPSSWESFDPLVDRFMSLLLGTKE